VGQLGLPAVGPTASLGQGGSGVGDALTPDFSGALVDAPFAVLEGLEREGRLRNDHAFSVPRGCDNKAGGPVGARSGAHRRPIGRPY
jgi:hypothetical protein